MRTSIYLFFISIIVLAACDEQDGPQIQGSTNIATEVRELDPFESIHISSVINATITKGDQRVSISANDNILDLIYTEVRGDVLYIELAEGNYGEISINADISNSQLSKLTTNGVNTVFIDKFEDLDQLTLNIEGVGNVEMNGSAKEILINSSGSSNLEAFDFSVENCEVNLTGVGNVQITVVDELFGALSGVGNILYKGTPEIDVDVTGVGNIVNAN